MGSAKSTIRPTTKGPRDTTVQVTVTPDRLVTLIVEPIGAALLAHVPAGMVFSQLATPLAVGPDLITAGAVGTATADDGLAAAGRCEAAGDPTVVRGEPADAAGPEATGAAATTSLFSNAATRPGYGPPGCGTPPPSHIGEL